MRTLPVSALLLGLLAAWPASADSIDDELNELNQLTTQQPQTAPDWCPAHEVTLLGVTSGGVDLKPGDYLLVAGTHPAGIRRSELDQKLSPLLTQQREELSHAQWGRENIVKLEGEIGARVRRIGDLQIQMGKTQDADTRDSIKADIDREQRQLGEDNQRLADARRQTEEHAAAATRLKTQTDPMLVESEALYNEVIAASRQCQP